MAVIPLGGCLFRSRKVERKISLAPLKTATQEELIGYINSQAAAVKSLQATVDIDTSVGGEKKGKITDYQQIRGYVLLRKPAMLRMIGLMPVVRNRAFDMVSNGQEFKLWIPPKNRFVEGRNDIQPNNTKQSLENLRPQHIYDALLVREIDSKNEIGVMRSDFETISDAKGHTTEQPDYEVTVSRKENGRWFWSRTVIFSRMDLLPHRQLIYDHEGNLATDVRYEGYKDYNGASVPSQIQIKRPQEEYDITLTILKLQVNEPMGDDKFALQPPPGAEIQHLDQPRSQAQKTE